jgi:competence protein ComEC
VPHHGSLTSSSDPFVQAVRPAVAVFSAGRANRFGHPAPRVLERYQAVGAEIFRTDRDGAIEIETDGYAVKVRTFAGRMFEMGPNHESPRKHESTKAR